MNMISMDDESFKQFKDHCEKAIAGNKKHFEFRGNIIIVAYAKYVIQQKEK